MASLSKILILEGIIQKISYERRDYESVDEKSLYIRLCPEKRVNLQFISTVQV